MLELRIPLRCKNKLIDMVDDMEIKKEIKYKAAEVIAKHPFKYRMKITLDEEGNMVIRFIYKVKTKFDWNSLLKGDTFEDKNIIHHTLTFRFYKYGRERFDLTTRHFGNIEVLTMKVKVKNGVNFKEYYKDINILDPDRVYVRDLERLASSYKGEEKELLKGVLLYMLIAEILGNVVVYQRDLYFEDLVVKEIKNGG